MIAEVVANQIKVTVSDPSGLAIAVFGIIGTLVAGIGGVLLGQWFEKR